MKTKIKKYRRSRIPGKKKGQRYTGTARKPCLWFIFLYLIAGGTLPAQDPAGAYPPAALRQRSPGNTTYFIDPVRGDDGNSGTRAASPWRSFAPLNRLILTRGDVVRIVTGGDMKESLSLVARGTEKAPVRIAFAPGRYDFFPEKALKQKLNISNTNGFPDKPKAVAWYICRSENVVIEGKGAEILFRGKMMAVHTDSSAHITFRGFSFDYRRPTVSEFTVVGVWDDHAVVQVHPDSWYEVKEGRLYWKGEGWEHRATTYWQVFDPAKGIVYRKGMHPSAWQVSDLGDRKLRIAFGKNPGFREGLVFQERDVRRDYAAFFTRRSEDIRWQDINIYYMHGMGMVSQFSGDLTFEHVRVAPRPGSGRTCAAWADILHFSGCRGRIRVAGCLLSAANDDAMNVHGTHLRIIEARGKTVRVRFMHPQTYGFAPFYPGDEIEFVKPETLLPYAKNRVVKVHRIDAKVWELQLEKEVPETGARDVVENVSWTPDVSVTDTRIEHIPTRGILVTTRGKVLIRDNVFFKTVMSAILIADDAASWYESGRVQDVTIRGNRFVRCGSPVINIRPENKKGGNGRYVHEHIRITGNTFELSGGLLLFAKSTRDLTVSGNTVKVKKSCTVDDLIRLKDCEGVAVKGNRIKRL